MAKGKKTNLDYGEGFTVVGTVQKIETFQSKGGGLNVKLQVGDKLEAARLIAAEGNVCEFTIRASSIKADAEPEEQDDLDLEGEE